MKLLLISPKNRSVYNFRGDLIKKIISKGYTVKATGPDMTDVDKIKALGAEFVEIPFNKDNTSILGDIKYCLSLYKLMKKEKPDAVIGYTIKPTIYGSIAAKLAHVKNIGVLMSGAGFTFTSKTVKAKILGFLVKFLYRISLHCANTVIFFNPDDKKEFCESHLVNPKKCYVVGGSGVNMQHFEPKPYPLTLSFFMISRLLKCKGVREYLAAADIIKKEYPSVNFYLLGKIEYDMLDSVPKSDIDDYLNRGVVELFPETHDVRPYFEMASVYVLPSYREGVPRSVLEAMAMARPVITTDTNGCRETVRDGVNGFLVPVKNVALLAEAMKKFIINPDLVEKMGTESLNYCKEKFDVEQVNEDVCKYMKI